MIGKHLDKHLPPRPTVPVNGQAPTPDPSKPYKLPSKLPPIFYEAPKRAFWSRNARAEWVEYPATHVRLLLLKSGVRGSLRDGEPMSPIEEHFLALRNENDVQWAGPLAGYPPGIHEICGTRVLVTLAPRFVKGKSGAWQTLRTFLGELLGDQAAYLYAWLKSALRSLYAGPPFRPGQALAIAGPSNCGKSLLQGIITELFGGRSAKPYRYLIGETAFNGELLAAEHLMIEDDAASTDLRTRRTFGSQLKQLIANEVVSFHPKGRQAMSMTPFWRVSISLNDEAENLMVLPPLDDSMLDKIILLKAFRTELPFSMDNLSERKRFREGISAELPAFIDFLHKWRIPPRMQDKRYGVRAWQNEELVGELQALQPEFRLLELIDSLHPWAFDSSVWEGTASRLRDELEEKDKRGHVSRLLSYNSACGQYLGRLVRHFPERIEKKKGDGHKTLWVIKR